MRSTEKGRLKAIPSIKAVYPLRIHAAALIVQPDSSYRIICYDTHLTWELTLSKDE